MTGPSDATAVTRVLAGRYRLIRLVGHGGMGSVYEAVHVHTDKHVAIKLLSPQLSKDLKLVARFRREAMAASRLEHENCVHVDDFGEDADGTFYIAMEFIDGHGLADELRKSGPLPPDRVARIGVQLLKALDAAHSAGVLHRDLKPQNVMLTQKPGRPDIVKVVDFGIAKITTNTPEDVGALTVPGTIFGTPEYMSPEQARGETLDVRSDLYSAAVVLWHMLLGRSPFRGGSVRETLMKVFTDEAPAPGAERPNLSMPAGFEAVLRRAMAKRRDDRYPDAASFLEAFRPYVAGSYAEVPRRPLSGLPTDGSAPPATLDDSRSATLALPENQLPPLMTAPAAPAAPAPPATPVTAGAPAPMVTMAAEATRFGAPPITAPPAPHVAQPLPMPQVPAGGVAPRVVTIEGLAKAGGSAAPAPPVAAPPPRRRKRLGTAGVLVLSIAALGAVLLAGSGVTIFYLVQTGFFDKKGKVMNVVDKDKIKVTTTGLDREKEKLDQKLATVSVDPVVRDEALARAKRAMDAADITAARKAYADAVAADPASQKALTGLAAIAMQQKDWPAACDAFEKLMPLVDASVARRLAPLYAQAKKFRDADR